MRETLLHILNHEPWVVAALPAIQAGDRNALYRAFAIAPRRIGKHDVTFDRPLRADWTPIGWSRDQAARTLFLLEFPGRSPAETASAFEPLFGTAEVQEAVALYQALPLLPYPELWIEQAAVGVRSSVGSTFRAIAHHNPYPSEHFEEGPWNQMVLKCLFVGVSLDPVIGIDIRTNRNLARMLLDYVHERWAAKRTVDAEIWRPIGPFAELADLNDFERMLTTGDARERAAAGLALASNPLPEAKVMLGKHGGKPTVTWGELARGR